MKFATIITIMSAISVSELNNLAEALNLKTRVEFHDGEPVSVICSVAPYSKIAVIYGKATFTEQGKDFTERLKDAELKPLNFIMPDNVSLNFENVFNVIGVPDDVRAVVYFDYELKDITAYLATLFNIPVIYVLKSIKTEGVLCAKVPFFLGNSTDFYTVSCPYHVILPDNVSEKGIAEQYVSVAGKYAALADYRVKLKVSGGTKKVAAYNLIEEAISSANASQSPDELLKSGLKIELANLATNGAIIYNSAEYCFKRITGFNVQEGLNFALLSRLTRLYALCAEGKTDPFTVPDYNKRVQELAEVTKSDDGAYLKGLLSQVRAYKANKDADKIKAAQKKELNDRVSSLDTIEKTYLSLGGKILKDFSPYLKALKLCGDLPETFNFMSLVRESGFTEDI